MIKIKLATDFSKTPGSKNYGYKIFKNKFLIPKLKEAILKKEKLVIDFDGIYGISENFLKNVFSNINPYIIKKYIKIISEEDNTIISIIDNICKF